MRALLSLPWLLSACPAAPVGNVDPVEVKLILEAADSSCDDDEQIDSIDSVRIFANGAATACISVPTVDTVAELQSVLTEQGVELPPVDEETGTLTILGYDSDGCDASDEDMCGQAAYTLPVDTITVPLFCAADTPSDDVVSCLANAP